MAARPHRAASRAKRRSRIAAWADPEAIRAIYAEAERITRRTGVPHEVDHILPLLGRLVSGLHVETNLRIIPKRANRKKGNRYEPE